MLDYFSPIGLVYLSMVLVYLFVAIVLPLLIARLLVFKAADRFNWKLEKNQKWLWVALLAIIFITYPWFSTIKDIDGRVVDATGQPIEGVLVTALWEYYPLIPSLPLFASVDGRSVAGAREAVTDKEGRFRVSGFTYFPPFNQKLWPFEPDVRFYHEGLRVDYRLSKFLGSELDFDWGIFRGSSWNSLDVVMVEADSDFYRRQASAGLWGFVKSVLSEDNDNCMWANIPVAITREYKTVKRGIQISEDTVKFGRRLPRNMEKCGVDISFFEGLDEWNIKIVQ
ncbi:MAG: carboxypeptidase-like regulatory domain-containing protein [Xanthomonadales bacterium]|nr:carboxypeptidase-like regulatory domain-containing protein [Xanthomonadales bacterium]